MTGARQQRELARAEALRLLGAVPLGRVVFTDRALPAIRPVNHLVDGQQIVFRTGAAAAITTAVDGIGTIVAFEADAIDPVRRVGWSVVVIGGARLVTDAAEIDRYSADPAAVGGRSQGRHHRDQGRHGHRLPAGRGSEGRNPDAAELVISLLPRRRMLTPMR